MQSNKEIKGRAIFSDTESIKRNSLKLYMYLVCRANLRNAPNKYGDNVRIFQQKDIVLSHIIKIIGIGDERTLKKRWEELEDNGLIRFCPRGWREEVYKEIEQEDGSTKTIKVSFTERWKIRNKHKDTYYEIPISRDMLFRKIPKETLIKLNEEYQLDEFVLKLYINLINYQEDCILTGKKYKSFTCKDIRMLLGYSKQDKINNKILESLNRLKSLGLIDISKGNFTNTYGVVVPVFVLNQANFYVNFELMDFETPEEQTISKEQMERLIKEYEEFYGEEFD